MQVRPTLISMLLFSVFFGACSLMPSGIGNGEAQLERIKKIPSISFRAVAQGNFAVSQITIPSMNIGSYDEAKKFLDTFVINRSNQLDSILAMDYASEQAIIFVLPTQPSGTIGAEIVGIEEQTESRIVHTVKWLIGPGKTGTSDITQPYHCVAINRSDKPVQFAEPITAYR